MQKCQKLPRMDFPTSDADFRPFINRDIRLISKKSVTYIYAFTVGLYYSSRGFYPGVFVRSFLSEWFCPGWFCPISLLSEHICYNRKLNTFNFRSLDPSPVASCHTFSGPLLSSVTYFMDGHKVCMYELKNM